jgi:hypothetical protein
VTFTHRAPFSEFGRGATYFEDFGVEDLISMGMSAQISLVHDFGEWQLLAEIHRLLSNAFHGRAQLHPATT